MATRTQSPTHTLSRRFLRLFAREQFQLSSALASISCPTERTAYAALILKRLLVLHLLQSQHLLAPDFLSHLLAYSQAHYGQDAFFQRCLLPLFHECGLTHCTSDIPALGLPLFMLTEPDTQPELLVPDAVFVGIFELFSAFPWSLSLSDSHVLGPAILSSIFEQQLEQKELGAYYTHGDVTHYITVNTLIPYLFSTLQRLHPSTFQAGAPLWRLLQQDPERYIQAALQAREPLPTETEREFAERQTRYNTLLALLRSGSLTSISDLISHNLDMQRLTLDFIDACSEPEILLDLYNMLLDLTILDPTCGSGAFLQAALVVLQPLYRTCLERILLLVSYNRALTPHHQELYRQLSAGLAGAPNRDYFVATQIITRNLYGVDMMDGAVDLCQLCLYLHRLAFVERCGEIEPFDERIFHVRRGNALIGEVRRVVSYPQQAAGVRHPLPYRETEGDHEQAARVRHPLPYRETGGNHEQAAGVRYPLPYRETEGDHEQVRRPLPYGGEKGSKQAAFHWGIEFPEAMAQGGFAVILGNPPFLEYSRVRQQYTIPGYERQSCGNLFAAVIERALELARPDEGFLGLVVPLSICGAERFAPLRHLLHTQTTQLWLANFAIFPCRLFEGAYQRLSLLLAQRGTTQSLSLHSTRIQRWYAAERPTLLPLINYTPATQRFKLGVFPKLASALQEQILAKLFCRAQHETLTGRMVSEVTAHFVYYQEATNYWTKASCTIPYYKKNGEVTRPPHGRFLYFTDQASAQISMALLNSSLFYLWFATYSDGFHLTHALVKNFPVDHTLYHLPALPHLAQGLQESIQANTRRSTRNTQPQRKTQAVHQIELEEFRMGRSKELLDQIDAVLASYYGFDERELAFILHFDGKYRGVDSRDTMVF